MKMRRFANVLLCMSIALIAAITSSGCESYGDLSDLNTEAAITSPVTETDASETEALSRTDETEADETTTLTQAAETTPAEAETASSAAETPAETEAPPQASETEITETTRQETAQTAESSAAESTPPQTTAASPTETDPPETTAEKPAIQKDGSYTTPEDVAEYIHTFGTLPSNFITKSEAKALGWDSSKGNLWDVAAGKSIGGDYFGNYEGLLPAADGRKYTECDVNYSGGYRGAERVIFSNDGLIFYTDDHYQSFTQLY